MVEKRGSGDGVMDLGFEEGNETILAKLLMVSGAKDEGARVEAKGARSRWHGPSNTGQRPEGQYLVEESTSRLNWKCGSCDGLKDRP